MLTISSVCAQEQDHPLPDRWHGLIIDQSTPEDAVAALGQPSSDKPENNFKPYPLDKRISTKGKAIRQLQYKNVPGFDLVKLYFADGKLAAIYLDLKEKIAASAIPNNYGIEFEPKISSIETSSDHTATSATRESFTRKTIRLATTSSARRRRSGSLPASTTAARGQSCLARGAGRQATARFPARLRTY
jgi:hypothetical protein